jgi:hypothetical protein
VKLELSNGQNRLACAAVIDSGSDFCVFPFSFLRQLGIGPSNAPALKTSGVGSQSVPTHFANIEISLEGVTKFSVYAGFTVGLERGEHGLLGQLGFFDRFNVIFLRYRKCLIEIPDQPGET